MSQHEESWSPGSPWLRNSELPEWLVLLTPSLALRTQLEMESVPCRGGSFTGVVNRRFRGSLPGGLPLWNA